MRRRRPPRSTLFPTRRSSDLLRRTEAPWPRSSSRRTRTTRRPAGSSAFSRSEEHTSELQSHSDLVCRLLLEKKKHGALPEATALFEKALVAQQDHARALVELA